MGVQLVVDVSRGASPPAYPTTSPPAYPTTSPPAYPTTQGQQGRHGLPPVRRPWRQRCLRLLQASGRRRCRGGARAPARHRVKTRAASSPPCVLSAAGARALTALGRGSSAPAGSWGLQTPLPSTPPPASSASRPTARCWRAWSAWRRAPRSVLPTRTATLGLVT